MYDKYTQLIGATANAARLPKNKGLLITNIASSGPSGLTFWAFSGDPARPSAGATFNIPITYNAATVRQDIIPIEAYAVTAINGVCAFILL
jgi:hypothetical protein